MLNETCKHKDVSIPPCWMNHRVTRRVQLRTEKGNMIGRIVRSVGQNLGRKTRRCGDASWPERRSVDIKSTQTFLESGLELFHLIPPFRNNCGRRREIQWTKYGPKLLTNYHFPLQWFIPADGSEETGVHI